ncbi:MAG: c-type cytochrome [Alphaproteobacteria bacterium]|nr:c-type cytochrome [Alphaproteobacteria bacterium]
MNNVSAAEVHRPTPAVAIEGLQVAQAAGNATAGATAFIRCRVCHTVERGEPNRVGPNLFGVVGRKAATVAGFNYSDPMKNSNITWDDATLNRYIQDAAGVVPGNKMQLAKGAINAQGAADIIAFLKTKM